MLMHFEWNHKTLKYTLPFKEEEWSCFGLYGRRHHMNETTYDKNSNLIWDIFGVKSMRY